MLGGRSFLRHGAYGSTGRVGFWQWRPLVVTDVHRRAVAIAVNLRPKHQRGDGSLPALDAACCECAYPRWQIIASSRSKATIGIIVFNRNCRAAPRNRGIMTDHLRADHQHALRNDGIDLPGMMLDPPQFRVLPRRRADRPQPANVIGDLGQRNRIGLEAVRNSTASLAAALQVIARPRNGSPVRWAAGRSCAGKTGAFTTVPTAVPPSGNS